MMITRHARRMAWIVLLALGLSAVASPVRAQGYGYGDGSGYGNPSPTSTPGSTRGRSAPTWVKSTRNLSLGRILVDGSGMTLYYFKKDSGGRPTCTGSCAQIWPPLIIQGKLRKAGFSGRLKSVTVGGARQVTYNGWPLYHYSGDKKTGDTMGQGLFGQWFAATPGMRHTRHH